MPNRSFDIKQTKKRVYSTHPPANYQLSSAMELKSRINIREASSKSPSSSLFTGFLLVGAV
jgi:hypothetical protein